MNRLQVLIYRVASNSAARTDFDELGDYIYNKYSLVFKNYVAAFAINDTQIMIVTQMAGFEYQIRIRELIQLAPEDRIP